LNNILQSQQVLCLVNIYLAAMVAEALGQAGDGGPFSLGEKEEAKLGIRDHIQNFNVQGDYIAGDKHVGAHIDNVSPGAIGAQTTKD
jgi:hypothetical protein